jgi:hypothetical protein
MRQDNQNGKRKAFVARERNGKKMHQLSDGDVVGLGSNASASGARTG